MGAYRTEEQTAESAATAAAEHEKGGVLRDADEGICRTSVKAGVGRFDIRVCDGGMRETRAELLFDSRGYFVGGCDIAVAPQ